MRWNGMRRYESVDELMADDECKGDASLNLYMLRILPKDFMKQSILGSTEPYSHTSTSDYQDMNQETDISGQCRQSPCADHEVN